MREQFISRKFKAESLAIIEKAVEIATAYRDQGYELTLRQLYYQFVSRDLLPNSERSYKNLGNLISAGRLAGLIDWSFISDRGRNINGAYSGYRSPSQFIESVTDRYFENIWQGQVWRPEVWVEKEALVDVVARACNPQRVPYMACKGYMSQSEMYEAAKRMEKRRDSQGLIPLVIHLGDHDPSGIDMTRDIADRLNQQSNGHVEVRRIALNMDQIQQYGPPPNPAKLTDSRGSNYVLEHGDSSWELDALEPAVLVELIQDELRTVIDAGAMNAAIAGEEERSAEIEAVGTYWEQVSEFIDGLRREGGEID